MTFTRDLPHAVVRLIRSASVAEFATISKAGLPIDTPTLVFPDAALTTLDVATGLAYPAKADRARRNPQVGMLFEGGPDQPVVSVAGVAAVCDADLQANMDRYLSETILAQPVSPAFTDWAVTREAVWYLTRILIRVTPRLIRWWDCPEAMDHLAHEWRAPKQSALLTSDPAPAGQGSTAPDWPQPPWHDLAARVLANKGGPGGYGAPGHLTLLDPEDYPLSFRVTGIAAVEGGFRVTLPRGLPWMAGGYGTLSFAGLEVFVGQVVLGEGTALMTVERALPILPIADDPAQVLRPKPATREQLMQRLAHETVRRGQVFPKAPDRPPEPTQGAKIRAGQEDKPDLPFEGSRNFNQGGDDGNA